MYDDASELSAYIFKNYTTLVSKGEDVILQAIEANHKSESQGMKKMELYLESKVKGFKATGKEKDLEANQTLFKATVRDRILAENEDEVFINRCPECEQILKTPRARQCLWCSHSWQ